MTSVIPGCKVASVAPADPRREEHLVNPQPIWTVPSYMFSVHQNAIANGIQKREERYRTGVDNLGYFDSEVGLNIPAVHSKSETGTRCLPSRPSPAKLRKRPFLRFWELRFQQKEKNPPPTRRTAALLVTLVVTLLVVVMGVALLTYWLITQGFQGLYSEPYEDGGSHIIEGQFHITSKLYSQDLVDPSSADFVLLSEEITKSLDELFLQSSIVRSYNFTQITNFSPSTQGTLVVQCRIVLKHPLSNAAQEVGLAFIQALERQHGRLPGDTLHVDIRSIRFTAWREESLPQEQPQTMDEESIPPTPPSLRFTWSEWSEWSLCIGLNGACNPQRYQVRSRKCRAFDIIQNTHEDADPALCRGENENELDQEFRGCQCSTTNLQSTTTTEKPGIVPETSASSTDTTESMELPEDTTVATTIVEKIPSPTSTTTTTIPTTKYSEPITTAATTTIPLETSSSAKLVHQDVPFQQPHHTSSGHTCQDCPENAVCLLLINEDKPLCLEARDPQDPRGCGGWCTGQHELCHALGNNTYQCVDDSECLPGEWRCMNGLCIPEERRCDGHFNCFDMSDETMCECSQGVQCGNQTSCLPASKRCDGTVDCWDGSDEVNCTLGCPASEFACNNGQCIAKEYFCDGFADCGDKSDEPQGCDAPCLHSQRKCRNGRCIDAQRWCDGVDTCGDNSDEDKCDVVVAEESEQGSEEISTSAVPQGRTVLDYISRPSTVGPSTSSSTSQTQNDTRTHVVTTIRPSGLLPTNTTTTTSPSLPGGVWKET